ncbi:hypothetical protein C8R47DRAFT_1225491 [Mycena vitilis]|nr:hypothetical protein C8R47DRAFT_1225491 [Mycena vitilis]
MSYDRRGILEQIVSVACDGMKLHSLSDYIDMRESLRVSSWELKSIVDSHPPFWTRFAYSPITSQAAVDTMRARSSGLLLDLTLRASVSSGLPSESHPLWESTLERFMSHSTAMLHTLFPVCREVTLDAGSIPILEIMLHFVTSIPTKSLNVFELVYPDPHLVDVLLPFVSDFIFDSSDRPSFPPFTALTITPTHLPVTVASHLSALSCSFAVRQPIHIPLAWERFTTLLLASSRLTTLVLDGVHFADVPDTFIAAVPLPGLTVLDVRFRGRTSMGIAVQRLNLPALHALVFRCDTMDDLICFLSYMPSLACRARAFRLITGRHCCVSGRFRHLYSLLHRVERLDIRSVSAAAFSSFLNVSTALYPHSGTKWRGCPALTDILVGPIPLKTLVGLVQNRRSTGFQDLRSLTYVLEGVVDYASRAWFDVHSPDLIVLSV